MNSANPNVESKASMSAIIRSLADEVEKCEVVHPAPAPLDVNETTTSPRIEINPEDVSRGLGQLVLTIVRLLHELLQRQAVRRLESNTLTTDEGDRLGRTLALQAREIERLAEHFGTTVDDLSLDLGPLGKLV